MNTLENTPTGEVTETERGKLSLTSDYIEKWNTFWREYFKDEPLSEIPQKTIDGEIFQLDSGVDRLIDFVILNAIDTVVLLDKSARYVRPLFETRFKLRNLDQEKYPSFCFINIGTEKGSRNKFEENYLGNESQIEHIRKAYSNVITEQSNILVVDEYGASGRSLANAKLILQQAFPSNPISATYAFTEEPFWERFDELLDVMDPLDLDWLDKRYGDKLFTIATPTLLSREFRSELKVIAKILPIPKSINPENKETLLPKYIKMKNRLAIEG